MNLSKYSFGGFETVITELAPRLVKRGVHVTVYCRKKLYNNTEELPREKDGVDLIYFNGIEGKNLGTLTHSFVAIINSILTKKDILFLFNTGLGIFIPFIKMLRIKVITNLDGVEWERSKWSYPAKIMFKIGAYFNCRYADVLISDAQAIDKIYKERYKVSTTVISYGAEIRDDLDETYISEHNLKYLGYYLLATRFIPENNPLFIIESFLKSNVSKSLVVLGRNYYKSKYEDAIKKIKDDRIIFLGHISNRKNLLELYKYSYVYIHGHSVGGTNPTMLEALANNSCILALDNVFNREMLEDEKYGFYFSLNSSSLIKKLNFLINNPEIVKKYKRCSRDRIYKSYNWDDIEEQYFNLISSSA